MEFSEKLKGLRKGRGLTQEELAEELFVSRTAVSKWESGRGYPGIDSLREISRYFGVTVDELICPDEIITAAQNEKRELIGRYTSLICAALDISAVLLLFIPIFGGGSGEPSSVSLFAVSSASDWIKIVYAIIIGFTVLNGICAAVISRLDKPVWSRRGLITGVVLSVAACAVSIATRQPYAGLICLSALLVKGILIIREKK